MQIFIPTSIFKYKVFKELNSRLQTIHITRDKVVFSNGKILVMSKCENYFLQKGKSLNLDFLALKKIVKINKSIKNEEVSIYVNLKDDKAEITYKDKKEIKRGIVECFKGKYFDFEKLCNDIEENLDLSFNLDENFTKLAIFEGANKSIIINSQGIYAKIGKVKIAEHRQESEREEEIIALHNGKNSLIGLDTTKGAKWSFSNDCNKAYRIQQGNITIIEMPHVI